MLERLWEGWLLVDEPAGLVIGVVVVWCLIRQNLWAWPLGVAYVAVSVTVLLDARLYANLALHVLGFLPMNLYGWYFWLYGKAPEQAVLPVRHAAAGQVAGSAAVCLAGALLLGSALARCTDAALPYWDSGVFVASLTAMWLTARKLIENWLFWLVINVVSVGVYWAQALPLYAGLYLIYIVMAVAGWRAWKRSMTLVPG